MRYGVEILLGLFRAALVTDALRNIEVKRLSTSITQSEINNIGRKLHVTYDVIDNIASVPHYTFKIILKNTGNVEIKHEGWSIYLCHIRNIISLDSGPGTMTHINGCLFKIQIRESIPDGGEVSLKITGDAWDVARTDTMGNWYVAADEDGSIHPRILDNTADERLDFVTAFDSPTKWKRYADDKYDPYSAEVRYDLNKAIETRYISRDINIVPTPAKIEKGSGTMQINGDWTVETSNDALKNIAKTVAGLLGLTISSGNPSSSSVILLSIGQVKDTGLNISGDRLKDQYQISMEPQNEKIHIQGETPSGVFYGVQSLMSLLEPEQKVPVVTIKDGPRYAFRGFMLDTARNFHPKETVLGFLDIMSQYKMNRFHLRLADDEGWRLEIPGLPELTEIGGKRCHDLNETTCTIPQLGSGPLPTPPGSGFYTRQDFVEILKYAKDRFIEVIPEFDSPGHAHAAIAAMLARYNKLKDINITAAEQYLLSDIHDTSSYLSVQMYTDNSINPCLNSTYEFIKKVVKEVEEMYNDSGAPLWAYHFGGDEPSAGAWKNSSACNWLRSQGITNLGEYFAETVAKTLPPSLVMAGWEDGLLDGKTVYDKAHFPTRDVYANAWQNVWEWGAGNRAYLLANAGFKVVMTPATHLYMDHPYEPDPEERGYYWATRFSDTQKMFKFFPDRLYENIQTKRSGERIEKDAFCKQSDACPALTKPENIIGMQGCVFSETVRTREQLEYMAIPRILAQAERAWHKADWESMDSGKHRDVLQRKDWERFANALGHKEMARLDKMAVRYRVPPPGGRIDENNVLHMNSEMPGLPLEYSTNKGNTWFPYRQGVNVTGRVMLRTKSADGSRGSRTTHVTQNKVSSAQTTVATSFVVFTVVAVVQLI